VAFQNDNEGVAGATGLEPATFGVTGRGFINKINDPSDSAPDISGPKTAIPTPELESFSRTKTAALLALMALSLVAFIATAWWVSVPCRPGEHPLYIGGAMLMAGCPELRR
jgi:hypothetical protein